MTERRTTITVGWRPQGAPARRFDDFQEAPAEPAQKPERRQQSERQVERRSIGRRLENWGMWANAQSSAGASSNAGAIYENARRAGLVDPVRPGQAYAQGIDTRDAEKINTAFASLPEMHRAVLKWTYVVGLKSWGVAGACGFPTREYDARLADAQAAIESVVNKNMKRQG